MVQELAIQAQPGLTLAHLEVDLVPYPRRRGKFQSRKPRRGNPQPVVAQVNHLQARFSLGGNRWGMSQQDSRLSDLLGRLNPQPQGKTAGEIKRPDGRACIGNSLGAVNQYGLAWPPGLLGFLAIRLVPQPQLVNPDQAV